MIGCAAATSSAPPGRPSRRTRWSGCALDVPGSTSTVRVDRRGPRVVRRPGHPAWWLRGRILAVMNVEHIGRSTSLHAAIPNDGRFERGRRVRIAARAGPVARLPSATAGSMSRTPGSRQRRGKQETSCSTARCSSVVDGVARGEPTLARRPRRSRRGRHPASSEQAAISSAAMRRLDSGRVARHLPLGVDRPAGVARRRRPGQGRHQRPEPHGPLGDQRDAEAAAAARARL